MGGMIAKELALRHPERLRALALGATHASYLVSRKPSLSAMVDFVRVVARGPANRPNVIGRLLTTPAFVAAIPTWWAPGSTGATTRGRSRPSPS
jgi:pimeloyl-ACP methyl ester carboxylesterase